MEAAAGKRDRSGSAIRKSVKVKKKIVRNQESVASEFTSNSGK
jgi:hypothetical protein